VQLPQLAVMVHLVKNRNHTSKYNHYHFHHQQKNVKTNNNSTHTARSAQKSSTPLYYNHARRITRIAFSLRACY
jgi:hypothetical protein